MAFIVVHGDNPCRAEGSQELNRKQTQSADTDYNRGCSWHKRRQGRLDCRVRGQARIRERGSEDGIKISGRNGKPRLNHNVFSQATIESNTCSS
jgi:hypothetical protein